MKKQHDPNPEDQENNNGVNESGDEQNQVDNESNSTAFDSEDATMSDAEIEKFVQDQM